MRAGLKIVLTEVVGEKNMRERVDQNRIENLRAIGVDVEFDNVDYVVKNDIELDNNIFLQSDNRCLFLQF